MIKKILNILILFSFMILNSCGLGSSIKNAVTGKTKPVGDEFLVEKKNPLVLPPNFDELPEPGKTQSSEVNKNDSFEDKILSGESKNEIQTKNPSVKSTEEFILKNINKNGNN